MSNELVAGPELNRRVAEAIGDESPNWTFPPLWRGEFPPYSTDLNAAFAAAVGLFGNGRRALQFADEPGEWRMVERYTEFGDRHRTPICVASAPTPALAICAAILKLKECDGRRAVPTF